MTQLEFTEKVNGEEFVISGNKEDCVLLVTHRGSGRWAKVTPGAEGNLRFAYRLDSGLGWQSPTPDAAVKNAMNKILEIVADVKGNACHELHTYLESKAKD